MRNTRKTIIIASILILMAGIYILLALSSIQTGYFNLEGAYDFSLHGFSVKGDIDVINPSFLPFTIKYIDYKILFDNRSLGENKLENIKLPARDKTTVKIDQRINFSLKDAKALLEQSHVYITVKTRSKVLIFTKEREDMIDIKPLIKDYLDRQIEELLKAEAISKMINPENIKDIIRIDDENSTLEITIDPGKIEDILDSEEIDKIIDESSEEINEIIDGFI